MLFGLGLGLIVAIGAYLRAPSGTPAAEPRVAAAAPVTAERPAARTAPRTSAPADRPAQAENRFEFYEILPQLEVVVPEDEAPAPAATRPQRPAEAPGSYLLQTGSFSAAADADRMQANLALLGFESHVQRVTVDDNVFNRVRIGPILDLGAAERARSQLRDAGYDPLLMRVPK
jgi:cell division protein FtsN